MKATTLPPKFAKLAKYVGKWGHEDFRERYAARIGSNQAELEEFYNAILPEIPAIMEHIDQCELGAADEETANLANLALSFMDVSPAVELFDSPEVPHGFDWSRMSYSDFSPSFRAKEAAR